MDKNKQMQKAGDNSTQNQIDTVVVNQGITEQRTREIFDEMFQLERKNYTIEAFQTAKNRIGEFEKILIPRMSSINGAFNSFADPYFQFLLRDTQKVASSTEKEDDYRLLSELLVCHIQKGDERSIKANVKMAIDIVDLIEQTDLCALTVAHAVTRYVPMNCFCRDGLKTLDDLFGKLIYRELPSGNEWQENLDMLGAIRISSPNQLKKMRDYYFELLNGYTCVGIKKESDDYKKALKILNEANLDGNYLVDHELLDGYVRIPTSAKDSIDKLLIEDGKLVRPIKEDEKRSLHKVWELYSTDTNLANGVNKKFRDSLSEYTNLMKLAEWWDSIPEAFRVTPLGNTLAHTNAKRCDQRIPDLL